MEINWTKEFISAVTICDVEGKIIYMNDKAASMFSKSGGYELIGKSLFECHNERSNDIIKDLIQSGKTNSYTIEKEGIKKLIFQSPWYENGKVMGLVEISHEIPFDLPHHIRS